MVARKGGLVVGAGISVEVCEGGLERFRGGVNRSRVFLDRIVGVLVLRYCRGS
jgi:hypothetical protein